MWTPTAIECRIAALVLEEHTERGANYLNAAWGADRFVQTVFASLASAADEPDEYEGQYWERLTYKQHCAFWHIVTGYGWDKLRASDYWHIVLTVMHVIEPAKTCIQCNGKGYTLKDQHA